MSCKSFASALALDIDSTIYSSFNAVDLVQLHGNARQRVFLGKAVYKDVRMEANGLINNFV